MTSTLQIHILKQVIEVPSHSWKLICLNFGSRRKRGGALASLSLIRWIRGEFNVKEPSFGACHATCYWVSSTMTCLEEVGSRVSGLYPKEKDTVWKWRPCRRPQFSIKSGNDIAHVSVSKTTTAIPQVLFIPEVRILLNKVKKWEEMGYIFVLLIFGESEGSIDENLPGCVQLTRVCTELAGLQ